MKFANNSGILQERIDVNEQVLQSKVSSTANREISED